MVVNLINLQVTMYPMNDRSTMAKAKTGTMTGENAHDWDANRKPGSTGNREQLQSSPSRLRSGNPGGQLLTLHDLGEMMLQFFQFFPRKKSNFGAKKRLAPPRCCPDVACCQITRRSCDPKRSSASCSSAKHC